jgi:hypothetical protein
VKPKVGARDMGIHADVVICNICTHIRKTQISLLDIRIRAIFLLSTSMQLLSAVIIRYPQINDGPILDAFKNSFDRFLGLLDLF